MGNMCNRCLLKHCSYEPSSVECQSAREFLSDYVYFELNHWSTASYPDEEPFASWMDDSGEKETSWIRPLDELDKYCRENKLVMVVSHVDMSVNFCVTAPRVWVEANCPTLLTEHTQFVYHDESPVGKFGCPFLEYSEENIGVHYYNDGFVNK